MDSFKKFSEVKLPDRFHYKRIKRKFDANLLLTDTDSLVYETETRKIFMKTKTCLNLANIHKIQLNWIQGFLILLMMKNLLVK